MIKSIFFAFLILCMSCSSDHKINSVEMDLALAKEKWEKSNINSYSFTMQVSCYCMNTDPNKIEVINNIIKKVNGKNVSQEELESIYWNVKSLNELFVIIEKKLSEDPFQYSIKYDEAYGFPTDAYFDMDEMIVDEEIGYYVTNFKIN